jgi:hypothetical protein
MRRPLSRALRAAALVGLALAGGACAQILGADFGDYAAACSSDATCDDGNPCTADACGAQGVCTHDAASDGDAPAAEQRTGDCLKAYCLGGVLTLVNDDGDAPDDGSACTTDACQQGRAVHTAMKDGASCAAGTATGYCAKGACVVECGPSKPKCDDGNRCTEDSCDVAAGRCTFAPLSGVPIPGAEDTPGDCRRPVCQAGIEQLDYPSPGDPPTLTSPDCGTAQCSGNTPTISFQPGGTFCGSNGGRVCDGAGTCVGCNVEADCVGLPPSSDCRTRSCTSHACKLDLVKSGTPTPSQTQGDCRTAVCDGSGGTTFVADDSDLPALDNACVEHLCTIGIASTPPLAQGTKCGAGGDMLCDGAGQCVGCVTATDCPGVDQDCQKRTCVAGVCGVKNTAPGIALPQAKQTPGDCQQLVCDGSGGVKSVTSPGDTPNDNNPCTTDSCSFQGAPTFTNKGTHTACSGPNGGAWCDGAGHCVACVVNGDCGAPNTCGGGNPGTPNVCGCTKKTCAGLGLTCGTASDGCGGQLACDDGLKNGNETDVDCGGTAASCPTRCGIGLFCAQGTDCSTGVCTAGQCSQ